MLHELAARKQWVMWHYGIRNGKQTKVPFQLHHHQASTTNPTHWTTYEKVSHALTHGKNFSGIGFVFTSSDPYCGIDLDHCVEDGVVAPWAMAVIHYIGSYAEYSASGTGIHIILRGVLPEGKGKRKGRMEVYDRGRYFTMSDQPLPGFDTIQDRQETLDAWYTFHWPKVQDTPPQPSVAASLDTYTVIDHLMQARNRDKFQLLFDGNWQAVGYGSHSEADAGLLSLLAFWTQDQSQLKELWQASKLWRPSKCNPAYVQRTITFATRNIKHTYKG